MKSPGVYRIFNKATKRSYVGSSSKDWANRRNGHLCLLRNGKHPSKAMQKDWNKYGPESFVFFLVAECGPEGVLALEEAACKEFGCFDKDRGYNNKPISGPRFRGGRPCGGKIRFSRMVSHAKAKKISELLDLDDETFISLELGSSSGVVYRHNGSIKVSGLSEPDAGIFGTKDMVDKVNAELKEIVKAHESDHSLASKSAIEEFRLRKRVAELEAKIKEYEQMYG